MSWKQKSLERPIQTIKACFYWCLQYFRLCLCNSYLFSVFPLSQTQKTLERPIKPMISKLYLLGGGTAPDSSKIMGFMVVLGFTYVFCFWLMAWLSWFLLFFPTSWSPCILIRTVREGARNHAWHQPIQQ